MKIDKFSETWESLSPAQRQQAIDLSSTNLLPLSEIVERLAEDKKVVEIQDKGPLGNNFDAYA